MAIEHLNQLVPASGVFVQRREGAERVRIVRRQREDLPVHLNQHRIELQRVPVDRDEVAQQPQLFLGGVRRERVDLAADRLGERIPLSSTLIELLKRHPGVHVAGLEPLDELPRLERALRALRGLRAMAKLPRQGELELGTARRAKRVTENG